MHILLYIAISFEARNVCLKVESYTFWYLIKFIIIPIYSKRLPAYIICAVHVVPMFYWNKMIIISAYWDLQMHSTILHVIHHHNAFMAIQIFYRHLARKTYKNVFSVNSPSCKYSIIKLHSSDIGISSLVKLIFHSTSLQDKRCVIMQATSSNMWHHCST